MTVWIVGILLLLSLAGLGYRQGVIRVAFSLVGILFGALLAPPLGRLVKPLFATGGVENPILLWLVPPLVMFVIVLAIFKVVALVVHQKVEVFYKYNTGDLKQALWERLSRRLGLCLGIANGVAYFILIVTVVYPLSYWTFQMASPDSDPKALQLLNRFGSDLDKTGVSRVARSLDRHSSEFYQTADFAGMIYQNPLLEARLSRYPAFIALAERPDFQDLGKDTDFSKLRVEEHASLDRLLDYPKIHEMLVNNDLVKTLKGTILTNLADIQNFLVTGISTNYTEKILGRWEFDVNSSMLLLRKANPTITSNKMKEWKRWMASIFAKATFVAAAPPDQQAYLKNMPKLSGGQPGELQTLQGSWKGADGSYTISLTSENKELTAQVNGDRMTISGSGMDLAFTRAD